MASYVDDVFPKADDIPLIETPSHPEGIVDQTVVENVTKLADEIMRRLGSLSSLTLDLKVESEPSKAVFTIRSRSGTYSQATRTDSTFSKIY